MNDPVFEVYERRSRFTEIRFEDIEQPQVNWLVKGVLPAVGVAYLAGPSKSGKSFIAVDWFLRIATGRKVLDCRTTPGSVIYFAAEDDGGIRLRVAAWRKDMGEAAAAFSLIPENPVLQDEDDFADLSATVIDIAQRRAAEGAPLKVVVFDTLSQSAPGAEENGGDELGPILSRLATLSRQVGCLVVLVAHTGKDEARGIRGWSGQLANADSVVMVERGVDDLGAVRRTLLLDKVKNGPDGASWDFQLRGVDMGIDADGDAITSCVPEYDEQHLSGTRGGTKSGTSGQNDRDKLVLRCLRICEDAGQTELVPPMLGVPLGTLGVPRSVLKDRLYAEGYGDPDESQASLKRKINRDILRLIEREVVRATPQLVWFRADRKAGH